MNEYTWPNALVALDRRWPRNMLLISLDYDTQGGDEYNDVIYEEQ